MNKKISGKGSSYNIKVFVQLKYIKIINILSKLQLKLCV